MTMLMPDPAGTAIAGFVMVVIGWYGMLRTGVQFIYNDIKDLKRLDYGQFPVFLPAVLCFHFLSRQACRVNHYYHCYH